MKLGSRTKEVQAKNKCLGGKHLSPVLIGLSYFKLQYAVFWFSIFHILIIFYGLTNEIFYEYS